MGQIKLILFLVLATIFLIGCSKEEIEKRKAVRLLNEIKENLQKDNFEEVMKKSLFIIKWESYPRAPGFFISTARLIIINFPLEFSPLNDNAKKLFLQYMNETETRSRLNAEYFKFDKIVNFKMNGNRYILKTLASYKNPFTGELIGEEHYYCFLKKSDKIYLLLGINIKDAL